MVVGSSNVSGYYNIYFLFTIYFLYDNNVQLENKKKLTYSIYKRIRHVDMKFVRDVPFTDKENFETLKINTQNGE